MNRRIFKTKPDLYILILFAVALAAGILLYFLHLPTFQEYIDEDGTAEWLTVIALLACTVISLARFVRLRKIKPKLFLAFLLLAAFVFFFGAGEELSWGQRIFNLESGEFFVKHNTQQELNLHNLVFGGVRINKLVFSLVLSVCVIFYLFILPVLYRKQDKIRALANRLAVPVARLRHVLAYLVLFLAIVVIGDSRKWELLEMGGGLLFAAIVLNPVNIDIFRAPGGKE